MADQATTTTAVSPCGATGGGTAGGEGGAAGGAQSMMGMLFPLAVFVLIFYFFIIRPQRKRQKQHEGLISSIGRGDQIVTIGGFFGTVREVRDDTFLIELAEGVRVRILKSAVQTKKVVTPSTPASEEKKD
ncbi:preprotein translocase subunit YajC [uncultured Fretibacterium sp.]|uniref:preprotein translocase subunit YajC n=1 Tax=uncultured Fretibacterium sp. TaxID=1678694 RepID=UPI00325FBF98